MFCRTVFPDGRISGGYGILFDSQVSYSECGVVGVLEMTQNEILENYLSDAIRSFRNYKLVAEKAIKQVNDAEFFKKLDPEANSIAVIVKHISGNQRSRWRNFLESDGEKPDRHRDREFELHQESREFLMKSWESGWKTLFDSIDQLTVADFSKTVTIRGVPHTIAEALNRQLTHYAYHVGQIVYLAKHFRSAEWKTMSVPKNQSDEFNAYMAKRKADGRESGHPLEDVMKFVDQESEGNTRSD